MAWNPNVPTVTNRVQDDLNAIRENFQVLDGHLADTNNPHQVTAAQVGAPTQAAFDAHVADTNNPHNVQAQQVPYSSGVVGFSPADVKAALDALARAEHATSSVSAFRAYQSADQSIPGGTWTKVVFQTEQYDHLGEYDTTNYRFVPSKAGIYFLEASAGAVLNAGVQLQIALFVNGTIHTRHSAITSGAVIFHSVGVAAPLKLNAGDVVEVYVYIEQAATLIAEPESTRFSGVRVA